MLRFALGVGECVAFALRWMLTVLFDRMGEQRPDLRPTVYFIDTPMNWSLRSLIVAILVGECGVVCIGLEADIALCSGG